MEPALVLPANRFTDLLARAERGGQMSAAHRAELANRFAEEITAEPHTPSSALQLLPRDGGALIAELLAIPRGATMLVAQLGAPRALLKLGELARLSVIAEDERTRRALMAALATGLVAEGPLTRYMPEDTFDYAAVGLALGKTLMAPGFEYDHARVNGSISLTAAAIELAVRSVRPGGFVAVVGSRPAFQELAGGAVPAWLSRRAGEIGGFALPTDGAPERLHVAVFEKRANREPVEPFRAVLAALRSRPTMSEWRRHLAAHQVGLAGYARSCTWARGPIPLSPRN